jgi:hypothetical protein
MLEEELLRVSLSPESHPALALSCADRLLWLFADQILGQRELAIAYPCLGCRGGLSIFLAYLAIAVEENSPGRPPDPVLVYPGPPDIRQAYAGLKVHVGELLDALRQRRIRAKKEYFVHPWEENLLRALRSGRLDTTTAVPLHDFFPGALLESDGSPRIFTGRDRLGRGDDAPPPLQFATKILRVPQRVKYRATVIMHDAIEGRSERQRVYESLASIPTGCLIHLFESPYSPGFAKVASTGKLHWRIQPQDFGGDHFPVPPDEEVRRMLEARHRVHPVPSMLSELEYRKLAENFSGLRQIARTSHEAAEGYSHLYNCYRLIVTLPVPPNHYNSVADQLGLATLSERIDDVKEVAEALGPGVAYSLIDESVQTVRSLLDRIEADPARARALLIEARRGSNGGQRIGIVVSSPVFASAIERFLAAELSCERLSLQDKGIHVVEARSLPHMESFDILVFFGYRGAGALRWMMSGRAREMVAILTEHERRAASRDLRAGAVLHDTWNPLRGREDERPPEGTQMALRSGVGAAPPTPEARLEAVLGEVGPELPTIPMNDEDFVREILDYVPPAGTSSNRAASGASLRTCRKVIFGDRHAYLRMDGSVTVLGSRGTTEKRVEHLSVGDIVVFVNGGQRRSIYELMLAEIKKSPAFAMSADVIQSWHRRLKSEFSESHLKVAEIHRLLRKDGSKVVPGTVAGWLRGGVMSPQDSENLSRLMGILSIPNPGGKHSGRIDLSARHLRNVYRQYAKAVSAFLLRTAVDDRPELDALLEKYGLDIEGIREAVTALEVEGISEEPVEVSVHIAGRLHDE